MSCNDEAQFDPKTLLSKKNLAEGPGRDPWVHRSKGMLCTTCMWFVPKVGDGPQPCPPAVPAVGRCRRHAPTMNGYPVVFRSDWCGDHKLD